MCPWGPVESLPPVMGAGPGRMLDNRTQLVCQCQEGLPITPCPRSWPCCPSAPASTLGKPMLDKGVSHETTRGGI